MEKFCDEVEHSNVSCFAKCQPRSQQDPSATYLLLFDVKNIEVKGTGNEFDQMCICTCENSYALYHRRGMISGGGWHIVGMFIYFVLYFVYSLISAILTKNIRTEKCSSLTEQDYNYESLLIIIDQLKKKFIRI